MPLLLLVLVSVVSGLVGAYVISRDPFHAIATGGTPGFASALASETAARRRAARAWIAASGHERTASSLALGAAVAVFVAAWLCIGLLAYFVRGHSTVVRVDSGVARWGYLHASAASDGVINVITRLGDTYVVVGLALVLVAADWVRRRNGRVVLFLVSVVAGDGLITLAVKHLMDRARPAFNPAAHSLGPSFPSGHASTAAAFYAAAALILTRGHGRRAAAALGGAAVAIAVGVAASRVFLDVHWVSDVVAGLALGWSWFAFCAIAFGGSPRRVRGRSRASNVGTVANT